MKTEDFTPEEISMLEKHPTLGYKYLSETYNLSAHTKMVVLQHHERPDGLGYPNRLTNDEISTLSKIVSIADAYDTLSAGRPNQKPLFPSDVLEYLIANAGTMFDYDMVNTFCKIVIPFSKGTLVDLSNGDIAVIQETLPNFPLRPIVKVLKSSNPDSVNKELNLIDEISITIQNIRYEI